MTKLSDNHPEKGDVKQDEPVESLSRRGFLNTAGIAAVGGLVVATGGSLFADKNADAVPVPEAPPLPWKYTELDPLEAGKRGYKSYLEKGG